eukprot:c25318_g1_i2 orf=665-1129(+)
MSENQNAEVSSVANDIYSCAHSQCLLQNNMLQYSSQKRWLLELGTCDWDTDVLLPTLNGWLLSYPVIYIFNRENISETTHNLSSTSLHQFKVLVVSKCNLPQSGTWELLSTLGVEEPWAQTLMRNMRQKIENVPQPVISLELEVTLWTCQTLVI